MPIGAPIGSYTQVKNGNIVGTTLPSVRPSPANFGTYYTQPVLPVKSVTSGKSASNPSVLSGRSAPAPASVTVDRKSVV